MKKLSLLALFGAIVLLAGCSTTSSQCGCAPANCCSWDFYQPCDLIEGRVDSQCPLICGTPKARRGAIVSTRCYELPPEPPAATEEVEEVVEEELPAPDVK